MILHIIVITAVIGASYATYRHGLATGHKKAHQDIVRKQLVQASSVEDDPRVTDIFRGRRIRIVKNEEDN